MRELVVTCDRCGNRLHYDEDTCKIIDGDAFLIPSVSSTGVIIPEARWVELCKVCIWKLGEFVEGKPSV